MRNDLIFNNGAAFPICPTDAADAPRATPGWRSWHITAIHADAVEAMESGLACREYESLIGANESGEPITETVWEDLSSYSIPGSVCDHRDGTVTVYARRETEIERVKKDSEIYVAGLSVLGVDTADAAASVAARLGDIRALVASADLSEKPDIIIDLPPQYCDEWVPGMELKKGRLVEYNAVKYLLVNDVTAQLHYPPDMPNGAMLSVYKPYQGKYNYTWLYGEYCEPGFTRYEDGKLYLCYQDPVANIYPPSQNPNCWKVVAE